MQQGLKLASEHFWTGIGFNTIRLYKSQNIHSSGGFDSSLLTTLTTSGIFGLIAFLYFYFRLTVKLLWKSREYKKSTILYGATVGFLASFLGFFAQSFFINSLFYSLFIIFIFGLSGVVLSKQHELCEI
jgi:O-antigen ligase